MCSKCSAQRSPAMSRRHFLRLGEADLTGAVLLTTVDPSKVLAEPDDASLSKEFGAAAKE